MFTVSHTPHFLCHDNDDIIIFIYGYAEMVTMATEVMAWNGH